MKLYVTVAVAAMMMTSVVKAQHVNVGIKGGLNLYNVHNDNGSEYDIKPGFNAGLLGHIHLAPQLALQPEVVYSAQGTKYSVLNVENTLNLGYINVPVLFQYMFDNGFRLQAGPQVGFLVSAKNEAGSVKTDVKDNYKSVDFGIGAGVGYVHVPSGFGVDARYNLGLSDISESTTNKLNNRGFQLGVFYLFNHK